MSGVRRSWGDGLRDDRGRSRCGRGRILFRRVRRKGWLALAAIGIGHPPFIAVISMMAPPSFEFRLVVPGTPRAQQRTRSRVIKLKSGKLTTMHYTPTQSEAEQAGIRWLAAAAMKGAAPADGPLTLLVCFYVPIPPSWSRKKQDAARRGLIFPTSRPDFDNYAKLISDSFKSIVWRDDARVVRSFIDKLYSDRPRIEAVVRRRQPGEPLLFSPLDDDAAAPPAATLLDTLPPSLPLFS